MKTNKFLFALVPFIFLLLTAGMARAEPPAVFFSESGLVTDNIMLEKKTIRRKKAIAIGLAIALGPFGVHRLYLGTDDKIPVIYSITLGAFGVLPLTDIIAIITTKKH